jgi:hypothetical protein
MYLVHLIIHSEGEDEEEDVSSYYMTFKNDKMLEIERGSTRSHSEKLALEEAMDLS